MEPTADKIAPRPKRNAVPPLKLVADDAAANIKRVNKRGQLSQDELAELLYHVAAGSTYKHIRNVMRKKFNRAMSDSTIAEYKDKYAGRVQDIATSLEVTAIQMGLTKKNARLVKLQELAEALETQIFDENGEIRSNTPTKTISEYREVLKLLSQESGGISDSAIGDINFVGLDNDALKDFVAGKLAANRDMAVVLADQAGARPIAPELKGANDE